MATAPTDVAPLRPSARRPKHGVRRTAVRWLKRVALVALGLAAVGAIVSAALPKPVVVDLGTARRGRLTVEVDEDGRTRVHDRFVVLAPISGNLLRIELDPGTVLASGAAVARIEAPDPAMLDPRSRSEATARLAAALARQRGADTAIARAKVARTSAVRDADRTRTLEAHGAVTAFERERAELAEQLAIQDQAAAELQRQGAIADVALARAVLGTGDRGNLASVTVPAPTSGQVLRVVRDSAGPVVAGAPLVELGDPRAIEVVVDVLSTDAARITPDMPVSLDAWGGEPVRGHVRLVEPSAFTKVSALGVDEQRVNVIVAIDDPPPALGDGFRVETHITIWQAEDVLEVPSSAVFRDHERWAVYMEDAGRARLRPVSIGHRGHLDVEITDGLAEGTAVVLRPGDQIHDGVRIAARAD